MPEFNDNELDKLFQEAADQIRPEFDILDWEQLSARLDQQDDKGIFYRSISLYGILILLLFLSARNIWREQFTDKPVSIVSISPTKETPQDNKQVKENLGSAFLQNKTDLKNDYKGKVELNKLNTNITASRELNSLTKGDNKQDEDVRPANSEHTINTHKTKISIQQFEISNKVEEGLQKNGNVNSFDKSREVAGLKNHGSSIISVHELNHERNNKSKQSVRQVSAVHSDVIINSENSIRQMENGRERTQDFQKGNFRNTYYLNKGEERDSSYAGKQSSDVEYFKTVANELDDSLVINSDFLSKDKGDETFVNDKPKADVLYPMSYKDDSTLTSDLNKNKGSESFGIDQQRSDVMHSETAPYKHDDKPINDLRDSNKNDSLSSAVIRRDINDRISVVIPVEGNSNSSTLHKSEKEGTYSDVNKQGLRNTASTITNHQVVDSTRYDSIKVAEDQLSLLQVIQNDSTDSTAAQTKSAKVRGLFIKLSASPDFSNVKNEKIGGPGINAGLLIEYNVNKHIAFETGVIWSKKIYDAHYAKVNFVEGDCRILDIPINVKYYLLPASRLNFFATAGFSSYVMLNEKYDYTVTTPNYGERHWSKEYSKKNNEWFSMLNFSVGVQRQVGKRIWFQAEPFFKAPIAGVGVGNIKLASMGAFLTLKYKLK